MISKGTLIGRYAIRDEIGSGGFARVYLAEEKRSKHLVAIKLIRLNHLSRQEDRDLFINEMINQARLSGCINIVHVYECISYTGSEGEHLGMVMEYVNGPTLSQYIAEHAPMPYYVAIPIFSQILNAIAYAHQYHMLHRDIKPGNIMINPDGIIKIMDFGLSKYMTGFYAAESARAASLFYVAPERLAQGEIDERTDIYSLGATFYHVLTGQPPHDVFYEDWHGALEKHKSGNIKPIQDIFAEHPPVLNAIIQKALAPQPEARYSKVSAFKQALLAFQEKYNNHQQIPHAFAHIVTASKKLTSQAPPAKAPGEVKQIHYKSKGRGFLVALLLVFGLALAAFCMHYYGKTPFASPAQEKHARLNRLYHGQYGALSGPELQAAARAAYKSRQIQKALWLINRAIANKHDLQHSSRLLNTYAHTNLKLKEKYRQFLDQDKHQEAAHFVGEMLDLEADNLFFLQARQDLPNLWRQKLDDLLANRQADRAYNEAKAAAMIYPGTFTTVLRHCAEELAAQRITDSMNQYEANNISGSLDTYRQARALYPPISLPEESPIRTGWAEHLLRKGQSYIAAGDIANALLMFQQAHTVKPQFASQHILAACRAYANSSLYLGYQDDSSNGAMLHGSLQRNSLYPLLNLTAQPDVMWRFTCEGVLTSGGIAAYGMVFFATAKGHLYALDMAAGTELWQFKASKGFYTTPAVSGSHLYAGNADGRVYALDTATGALVWRYKAKGVVRSSPAVYKERIYFACTKGYVYALKPDGSLDWRFRGSGKFLSSPAIFRDTLYIGSTGGILYALHSDSGKTLWTCRLRGGVGAVSPCISDSLLVIASLDCMVYCLDIAAKQHAWSFHTSEAVSTTACLADGMAYLGCNDNHLYALDLASGKCRWSFAAKSNIESSPVVGNGVVLSGSFDNNLYALDMYTGAELWSLNPDNSPISLPLCVSEQTVILASENKRVVALSFSQAAFEAVTFQSE